MLGLKKRFKVSTPKIFLAVVRKKAVEQSRSDAVMEKQLTFVMYGNRMKISILKKQDFYLDIGFIREPMKCQ